VSEAIRGSVKPLLCSTVKPRCRLTALPIDRDAE